MSGAVLCFPGIDPASVRPEPQQFEDLLPGERAIVVARHDDSFLVSVRPIENDDDAKRRLKFAARRDALQFARRMRACWPRHFQLVIDETGRQSLSDLLDNDPDPMGIWRGK